MYLKIRAPLPINSNPGMVFPRRHFAKMDEVADLGALFIDDLLDYKEMLDRYLCNIHRKHPDLKFVLYCVGTHHLLRCRRE
jgi:hypothetical protein